MYNTHTSLVKRIHNHLTDVHNKKQGSKEYKYWLKMAVIYQRKDISESSEPTPHSSSSEDVKETAGRRKYAKLKECREFYKQVYSSNEESFRDEYPSIFQDQTVEQETLVNSPMLFSEKDPSCSNQFESPGDKVVLPDDLDGEFVDVDGEDEDLDDDKKDDIETPRSQYKR